VRTVVVREHLVAHDGVRHLQNTVFPSDKKFAWNHKSVLQNQCCGSGMFIPDPDFHPSRIPDPTTPPKEGEIIFWSYHKIVDNFIFEQIKKFFSQKQ
jgi:hypothetical protein